MKYYQNEPEIYEAPKPRTRNRGSFSPLVAYSSYWWNTSQKPKPVKPALVSNGGQGFEEAMYDWVTPGFKERSSKGQIFNSPMSKTTVEWEVRRTASVVFKNVVGTTTYYGEVEGILLNNRPTDYHSSVSAISGLTNSLAEPDWDTMRALAATEARANIAEPNFEGLVSLGEMGQTLRYLMNPFKTGLKLASSLQRKISKMDPSKGNVPADLASLYLEFRYGVRPLVKEVESALLNLVDLGKLSDRFTARAKQTFSDTGGYAARKSDFGGIKYDETLTAKRIVTLRSGFLYAHEFSSGSQSRWGMRLSDIPTAMWELVPLSFVYDWVGNVGDFISALTPRAGVNILSQWTTVADERYIVLSGSNYRLDVAGWSTTKQDSCEVIGKVTFKTRTPTVEAPSIAWRGFDKITSDALKVLDLISIFDQKLNNAAQSAMRKQNTFDAMVKKGSRLNSRLNRF